MALYSGSANSFEDLHSALVNAATLAGWTWADGILSKGAAYVRPFVSETTSTVQGPGLLIEGGTGKSGASLAGASGVCPRFGRPGSNSRFADVVFPASYKIHAFTDPDEIYLVVRYSVDRFGYIAFGVSALPLPGTGLWLTGSARGGYVTGTNSGYTMTPDSGGTGTGGGNANTQVNSGLHGVFWGTSRSPGTLAALQDCIHANLDGEGWSGKADQVSPGAFNAIRAAVPNVGRSPSLWNGESPLMPIQGHVWRASAKCSLVVDLRFSRYVRIDNYEPEQIITLGADEWIVYPFYLKNSAARDGGSQVDHTGTFGWAIRYDGA